MLKELKRKPINCTHSKHLVQEMLSCLCQTILGHWPKYVEKGEQRCLEELQIPRVSEFVTACYQFMFSHSLWGTNLWLPVINSCFPTPCVWSHSKNEGTHAPQWAGRAGAILQGWSWLWRAPQLRAPPAALSDGMWREGSLSPAEFGNKMVWAKWPGQPYPCARAHLWHQRSALCAEGAGMCSASRKFRFAGWDQIRSFLPSSHRHRVGALMGQCQPRVRHWHKPIFSLCGAKPAAAGSWWDQRGLKPALLGSAAFPALEQLCELCHLFSKDNM